MNKKLVARKLAAFTLTELLIVLVIIGILVLIALPNFTGVVQQAYHVEAKEQLRHLYTMEKTYFMMHSKFSPEFGAIAFEPPKVIDDGGTARYRIEIVEAGTNSFVAQATAVSDFDGDGQFNVWTIDQDQNLKEVTPD